MFDFIDKFRGKKGRPVRRDMVIRSTVDEDGRPIHEVIEAGLFELSPEGSIDRVQIKPDRFYHCGCSAEHPMGGRCGEPGCNRVSCDRCFGRCEGGCMKPTCLEHARFLIDDRGRRVRLCIACYEDHQRRRRLRKVFRCAGSLFIDFKE